MEARGVRTRQWRDRGGSARSDHAESAGDVILNVVEQSPKRNAGERGRAACHSAAIGAMRDATSFAARCEAGWPGSSEAQLFNSK
jgi:hypothetical protein